MKKLCRFEVTLVGPEQFSNTDRMNLRQRGWIVRPPHIAELIAPCNFDFFMDMYSATGIDLKSHITRLTELNLANKI